MVLPPELPLLFSWDPQGHWKRGQKAPCVLNLICLWDVYKLREHVLVVQAMCFGTILWSGGSQSGLMSQCFHGWHTAHPKIRAR